MFLRTYAPLAFVLLGEYATAAVLTAPTATITAAPLKARDITTVGYLSTGNSAGTTLWDTITVNEQDQVIATSSNLFQICAPGEICEFFSCSNDYVVYPSSSIYCGMSNVTCSYYILQTDINDRDPLTNYWCDAVTATGGIIYQITPDGDSSTPETPIPSPSTGPMSISETSASSSSSRVPFGFTPSPSPEAKKSAPVGAIAGGVIGGIAVLGAVIFGVFFLLRRKRNKAKSQTVVHAQAPQQQPQPAQYYGTEQKPVGVAQVQQMPPPQLYYDPNANAPQFYDPNAQPGYGQQAGYAMPEKTPAATNMQVNPYYADGGMSGPGSPVPVYTPTPSMSPVNVPSNTAPPPNINELPTSRM